MEMDGHTLRKPARAIEKDVLDWNPEVARRRGRPKILGEG
jgi:hypothetical protein